MIINKEQGLNLISRYQEPLLYASKRTSTAIINWGLIFVFVEYLDFHYLLSINVAVVIIYFYSYLVNKFYVFRNRVIAHVKQGSSFVAMRVVLLVVANLLMFIGVDWLGIHYLLTAILISVWDATASFLIMKFFIFTDDPAR